MRWLSDPSNKRYLPEELAEYCKGVSTRRLEYYLQLQEALNEPLHEYFIRELPYVRGSDYIDDTTQFLRLCPPNGDARLSRHRLYKLYALWSAAPIKQELFNIIFKASFYGCPKESSFIRLFDNKMKRLDKKALRRKEFAKILYGYKRQKKITRPFR